MSLVPVVLGFLIMMAMTGKQMQEKMKEYQNALDDMSNEAVEYVRGIPVVKTFGQTIFSFKKFKDSIDRYKVWVIAYTKQLRTPMMFYTAAINGVFATLIAGGLLLTQDGVTSGFLLDLIFYIIITPVISVTLTRIMFQSENAMIVDDALQRIDSVLNLKPLEETKHPKHPQNASVELKSIHFSYDGEKEVGKVPLHNLEGIVSFGYRGTSPALMGACADRNISLCYLTPQGKFLARVTGKTRGNVILRDRQYTSSKDEKRSLEISKNCISGKVYNARWVLERAIRDHAMQIDKERVKVASLQLKTFLQYIQNAESKEQLRGYEGEAASIYF